MLQILFVFLIAIFIYNFIKINTQNVPPGPLKFPIIGNIYYLIFGNDHPGEKFKKLNKKYGKLVSVHYGTIKLVVSEDAEVLKEMLSNEIWSDRYSFNLFRKFTFDKNYGLVFSIGETAKRHRRFTLQTLRDFGFGKKISMEDFIAEEFKILSEKIDASIDSGKCIFHANRLFTISTLNILWGMIAGIRFSYENEEIKGMIKKLYAMSKQIEFGKNPTNAFPSLEPIFKLFMKTHSDELQNVIEELQNYVRNILTKRRKEGTYQFDQRDFIDIFLKLIDDSKNGPDREIFNDDSFVAITLDLFMAGSETSANSLEFSILYSILNPWVQKEVQNEIDKVIGKSRFPTLEDKPNLPFTEATILEIQRHANIVPTMGRSNYVDTKFRNFDIPKNTLLLINLYGLHMSEEYWEEPYKFNPKRFLDENRKIVNTNKIFPFGGGRRNCLGEVLAKSTLFIYYANLMHKYTFSLPEGQPLPSATPEFGFTLNPKPFQFHVMYRN